LTKEKKHDRIIIEQRKPNLKEERKREMTALTYVVGNEKYLTYSEALFRGAEMGIKPVAQYEPIEEPQKIDLEIRSRRVFAIRAGKRTTQRFTK
jgi:hypothetical protein